MVLDVNGEDQMNKQSGKLGDAAKSRQENDHIGHYYPYQSQLGRIDA